MSDYRINFSSVIGPSDTDKLYSMLDVVGEGDELIIVMDANDSPQTDTIFTVLRNNNFDVHTKGGHDDGKYHIVARRKE
jgi:hypothetical protein